MSTKDFQVDPEILAASVDEAVTEHINAFIREFRKKLPDDSKTAIAIDERKPRGIIAECAKNEQYEEFGEKVRRMMLFTPPHMRYRNNGKQEE